MAAWKMRRALVESPSECTISAGVEPRGAAALFERTAGPAHIVAAVGHTPLEAVQRAGGGVPSSDESSSHEGAGFQPLGASEGARRSRY